MLRRNPFHKIRRGSLADLGRLVAAARFGKPFVPVFVTHDMDAEIFRILISRAHASSRSPGPPVQIGGAHLSQLSVIATIQRIEIIAEGKLALRVR